MNQKPFVLHPNLRAAARHGPHLFVVAGRLALVILALAAALVPGGSRPDSEAPPAERAAEQLASVATDPDRQSAERPVGPPRGLEIVYVDPETGELRPTPPDRLPTIDLTIRISRRPPPVFETFRSGEGILRGRTIAERSHYGSPEGHGSQGSLEPARETPAAE